MAAKTQGKATPKPKAKQAGRRLAAKTRVATAPTPRRASTPPAASASADSPSRTASASAKKRERDQSNRRDIREKRDRLLTCGRLDHIPKSVWSTKVNSKGQLLEDVAELEVIANLESGGKTSTRWWAKQFEDFGLHSCVDLEKPTEKDVPPPEMLEAFACIHKNKIQSNKGPLESFLQHCDPLGENATYGLIKAVMPSPTLSHNMACGLQISVAKMWKRMSSHVRHRFSSFCSSISLQCDPGKCRKVSYMM